jgi:PPK2 family polyphosphate:nucleotide phosphotransferase
VSQFACRVAAELCLGRFGHSRTSANGEAEPGEARPALAAFEIRTPHTNAGPGSSQPTTVVGSDIQAAASKRYQCRPAATGGSRLREDSESATLHELARARGRKMIKTSRYRIDTDSRRVDLSEWKTDDDGGLSKDAAQAEFRTLQERFVELTRLLYAESKHGLLIVFQGMDTSGKDSSTRALFHDVSPTGVDATSFKAPTAPELGRDFLWRVHQHVPPRGDIAIFNRSHYEDVLIVRVHELVPTKRWKARYDHINAFEKLLADEGTTIVKFYLHVSKQYQKERLQKRLADPKKHWKFNPGDLAERERWTDYMEAYEDALRKCSTHHAPWFVIPAEKRWFRDLLMGTILVETLEALGMSYPVPSFNPAAIVIPD